MLIGLTGFAGTGKDTVADILVEDYDYERLSFADPLKDMFCASNGLTREELELRKRSEMWIREGLQELGLSKRAIREDYWIHQLELRMHTLRKVGAENFVISDVRFENELESVHQWGGQVWRIVRPGTGPANDHISERPIPGVDLTILNNKSIGHLANVVSLYHEAVSLSSAGKHAHIVDLLI